MKQKSTTLHLMDWGDTHPLLVMKAWRMQGQTQLHTPRHTQAWQLKSMCRTIKSIFSHYGFLNSCLSMLIKNTAIMMSATLLTTWQQQGVANTGCCSDYTPPCFATSIKNPNHHHVGCPQQKQSRCCHLCSPRHVSWVVQIWFTDREIGHMMQRQ